MGINKLVKKQKKFLLVLLTVGFLSSCGKNEKEEKTYYPSGNLESIKSYNNDSLVKTVILYDSILEIKYKEIYHKKGYDSIIFYYKNGILHKAGNMMNNGNYFGKWHSYTKEGLLSETNEYMVIKGETKLNQIWFYNQKGDTMYYGNKNFNIYDQDEFREDPNRLKESIAVHFYYSPDTISLAEPFSAVAEDWHPLWKHRNSESYVVLGKEKFNFNEDFSNEHKVKADTFYCLEKDDLNRSSFPKSPPRYTVAFGRWFNTPGKKILRGYVEEKYTRIPTKEDDISMESRRTYFEKIIYVKDTIKIK